MTTKELMGKCQEYYGLQYSQGMGSVVAQYLNSISDQVKPYLFVQVAKTHSVSFKSLPDVSTFESVHGDSWADYNAENPQHAVLSLPVSLDELASEKDIDEFETWFKTQNWKRSEFKKVKDWKREDRLC
jgi:hypothetical protein